MTEQYGKFYWCVKVPKDVSPNGEIYLCADSIDVTPAGDLLFFGPSTLNIGLAAGKWVAVYAASMFDGSAVAVEHWSGEIVE